MKKQILDKFLNIISKITGKKVLYINKNYIKYNNLAVKSKYGFWYCGNVFDQTDIAYGIAYSGSVEPYDTELVHKILNLLKKDYTFYDIGANTGWYSMLAAKTSDSSKVLSFEPLAEHLECLKESSNINKFNSIISITPLALSDSEGEAEILLAGSGSSLEKNFLKENQGSVLIKTDRLDSLVSANDHPLPDFIKIDVEGHEYSVLLGARETISRSVPILFIEIAYSLKNIGRKFINDKYIETFSFLRSIGYEAYIVKDEMIRKYDPNEKIDGVWMYLFLNENKHRNVMQNINIANLK